MLLSIRNLNSKYWHAFEHLYTTWLRHGVMYALEQSCYCDMLSLSPCVLFCYLFFFFLKSITSGYSRLSHWEVRHGLYTTQHLVPFTDVFTRARRGRTYNRQREYSVVHSVLLCTLRAPLGATQQQQLHSCWVAPLRGPPHSLTTNSLIVLLRTRAPLGTAHDPIAAEWRH